MDNYSRIKFFLSVSFISISLSTSSLASMHEFETISLKSRAGSGSAVKSIEESGFLNPATQAFMQSSSLYYQRDSFTKAENDQSSIKNYSNAFLASDTRGGSSASISYIDQKEGLSSRKRFGLAAAFLIRPQTALGYSIRYSKDQLTSLGSTQTSKYYQSVIGLSEQVDSDLSTALTFYDVFKSKARETKAIWGMNYDLAQFVSLNSDLAFYYAEKDFFSKHIWSGSFEFKILDDFILRIGAFNNRFTGERGEGIGLTWAAPRFSLDFGIKNTRNQVSNNLLKNKEAGFSISMRGL